jgi:hypothetical protein
VTASLAIHELPSVVRLMVERADPLASGQPTDLQLTYLRRKRARGLLAVYRTRELGLVTLSVDEALLDGARIRLRTEDLRRARVEGRWPGVLSTADGALSLLAFPSDPRLPRLAACCTIERDTELFQALEAAGREQLNDRRWELALATAEPIRYKPGSRCVIRYRLAGRAPEQVVGVVGKLYRDPEDVRKVGRALSGLYDEQVSDRRFACALVPRPLGVLASAGVVLGEEVRVGQAAFAETVRHAAVAAARLHTSAVRIDAALPSSETDEATRLHERAEVLAAHHPARSDDVLAVAAQLESRLRDAVPDAYRPSHGSFKPSQLLVTADRGLVLTDLDQFGLADPARDVGYFLAYLRPSALWYGRASARRSFESTAAEFVGTYERTARELGLPAGETRGIVDRSHLYEAALLFKIAARRTNRMNSARGGEFASILTEATRCVEA